MTLYKGRKKPRGCYADRVFFWGGEGYRESKFGKCQFDMPVIEVPSRGVLRGGMGGSRCKSPGSGGPEGGPGSQYFANVFRLSL